MLSNRLADFIYYCFDSSPFAESFGRTGLDIAGCDWLIFLGVVLLLELVSSLSLAALIFSMA